jgi:hypothetical protein
MMFERYTVTLDKDYRTQFIDVRAFLFDYSSSLFPCSRLSMMMIAFLWMYQTEKRHRNSNSS